MRESRKSAEFSFASLASTFTPLVDEAAMRSGSGFFSYASTSRAQSFVSTSSAIEMSSRRVPESDSVDPTKHESFDLSYYAESIADTVRGPTARSSFIAPTHGSQSALLVNDSWTASKSSLRNRHSKLKADDGGDEPPLPAVPTYDRSVLGIKLRSLTGVQRERWTRDKSILLAAVTIVRLAFLPAVRDLSDAWTCDRSSQPV